MEEDAFKAAKEESDALAEAKEGSKLAIDSSKEGAELGGIGDSEVDAAKQMAEAEEEAERKQRAAEELLKPKFSNLLLDLGNESAARQEAEEKAAKEKRKGGLIKPPPETYVRSASFVASKWVVKLSEVNSVKFELLISLFYA